MTRTEFITGMVGTGRYKKVKDMIMYSSIDKVLQLYELHKSCPNNFRFNDLQKHFDMRFKK